MLDEQEITLKCVFDYSTELESFLADYKKNDVMCLQTVFNANIQMLSLILIEKYAVVVLTISNFILHLDFIQNLQRPRSPFVSLCTAVLIFKNGK
jgi:hypothetical protein